MQIVLPGALPDPRDAKELTSYLPKTAPTLLRWLERSRARSVPADPVLSGCTAYEHWELSACGFKPTPGQNFSAGLGPLRFQGKLPDDLAIWLAELVHLSPSRDGAVLLPANTLDITSEQSVALFQSASTLFTDTAFKLAPDSTQHWRIDLPPEWQPQCASPSLVSTTTVNDWWLQDMEGRPWRKLANEIQMLWFEDPVNQMRYQSGQMPVNGLWLFGGASLKQLADKNAANTAKTYHHLQPWHTTRDWGGWLAALTQLEAEVFLPLADSQPDLVLTGSDRYVTLKPNSLSRWTHFLPGQRNHWRSWWSPQN